MTPFPMSRRMAAEFLGTFLFGEGVESAVSPVGVRPAEPRARSA
jgi:hypothetical protein